MAGNKKDSTLTCDDHNEPNFGKYDYLGWSAWAEKRSKTHKQIKCPECGLYKIWVPREKRKKES